MRLGCDPEVFLVNNKGKLLSVIGKIGANKHNPKQIESLPLGFTLQEDNVALEFGIPPASSAKEFSDSIETVMQAGLSNLPGTWFSTLSCAIFPKDQMRSPEAFVFGCEPDYNAWTGEINQKPIPPHKFMRSSGGHVHIETTLDKQNVIRACDLFMGVPSVLMDSGHARRALYGAAGCFRPKPYGVEYRTLSNFWIFKPELREWVWRATESALKYVIQDEKPKNLIKCGPVIQECINTGNKDMAKQIVKDFGLEVVC